MLRFFCTQYLAIISQLHTRSYFVLPLSTTVQTNHHIGILYFFLKR